MSPKYTSLEDGQVIVTDEPRPDLDALARWERDDSPATPETGGIVPSSPGPVAGQVNTDAVTGGQPPLTSTTAGFSNPADIIDQDEALRRAQAAAGTPGDENPTGGSENDAPQRPALNGSTEDWAAFAKHLALDVADDAGRDTIIAAYIEKFAPAGNASGKDWADYASDHGVAVDEKDGRDKIRAAVVEAGWAKA